ncbi:hypothetical protein GY45DRAFT_1375309 [Cubamyces sp. BRFM 1775]|nr:hypothetical protein GY45DRAFT_1375309 [Cubamyces sp. BRFM 1775]
MVAPWTIYAERLFPLGYGYPLWCPGPSLEFGEVQIGDVGYRAFGHFHFLFNCFHPADHPKNVRGVPDSFETLEIPPGSIQEFPNELSPTLLKSEGIQSLVTDGQGGVSVSNTGAEIGARYKCTEHSGAMLLLKKPSHRRYLSCGGTVARYMSKHLKGWYAFATDRLGIDIEMSDLIFVSGHFKTPLWAEAAFSSKTTNSELLLRAGLNNLPGCSGGSLSASLVLSNCESPVVFHHRGPIGSDGSQSTNEDWDLSISERATADQCIFINYYKMKFRVAPFRPKVLRGAAGPHDLPPPDDTTSSSCLIERDSGDTDNTDGGDLSIGGDDPLMHNANCLAYEEGMVDPVDAVLDYVLAVCLVA